MTELRNVHAPTQRNIRLERSSRTRVRIKVGTRIYLLCSLFSMHPEGCVAQVITRLTLATQQWWPVKLKPRTICKSVVFRACAIYNLGLVPFIIWDGGRWSLDFLFVWNPFRHFLGTCCSCVSYVGISMLHVTMSDTMWHSFTFA